MPTENIGYTTVAASNVTVGNVIRGSKFSTPSDGVDRYLVSITAYFDVTTGVGGDVKFAVYKTSDNGKVAESYGAVIQVTGWLTCTFPAPLAKLSPNTEYCFVAWSSETANCIRYAAESGKGAFQNRTFDGFPDPWSPASEDKKCSIYVTVSKDVGDEAVKKWYGRSDTHAQNGLTAYKLSPANSSALLLDELGSNASLPVTACVGVKLFRRQPSGAETELTGGVSGLASHVFSATGTVTKAGATVSVTHPKINSDDVLVVRVYADLGTNPPTTFRRAFCCAAADAEKNISFKGDWTFSYRLRCYFDNDSQLYVVEWRFGSAGDPFCVDIAEPRLIDDLARVVDNVVDWGESVETKYVGVMFKKKSKTDLENAIDSLSDWKDVLTWSARCAKLGVERETAIKGALDSSMMVNGLPKSGNDGSDYFHSYDAELLYGFYWADKWSYQTGKWNKLTGKDNLKTALANAGRGFLKYYSTASYDLATNRFYDENGQCLRNILLFREFFGYGDAQSKAEDVWTYLNSHHWCENSHFGYRDVDVNWECEGGGFLSAIAYLEFYNRSLGNIGRLYADLRNRTNRNRWFAPIWMNPATKCSSAAAMIHAWDTNSQRRLQNTLMIWAAIMGTWIHQSSDSQTDVKALLEGYATGGGYRWRPAWLLFMSEKGGLYVASQDKWKGVSTDSSPSNLNTARAAALMFMMGVVPDSGMLAVTLEELHYEYVYNVIDPDLFAIDIANRKVTVSVYSPGTVKFLFGNQPASYGFTQSGVFEVTFAADWNSITSVTRSSGLPSNRKYLGFQNVDVAVNAATRSSAGTAHVSSYAFQKSAAASPSSSEAGALNAAVNAYAAVRGLASTEREFVYGVFVCSVARVLAEEGLLGEYLLRNHASAETVGVTALECVLGLVEEAVAHALGTYSLGLGLSRDAAASASVGASERAQFGVAKEALASSRSPHGAEAAFMVSEDAVSQALAGVLAELVSRVFEIFATAVAASDAASVPQSALNLHRDTSALSAAEPQASVVMNVVRQPLAATQAGLDEELVFGVVKGALTVPSSQYCVRAVYPVGKAAVLEGQADVFHMLGIGREAAVVSVSTPLVHSVLGLWPDAVVKVLAEVIAVEEGEARVTRLFLVLGGVVVELRTGEVGVAVNQ